MHEWEPSGSKTGQQKCRILSITQLQIVCFHSNFVHSLNMWHSIYYKTSRSLGQRSRSQQNVTPAKIYQIVNNSTARCRLCWKECHFDISFPLSMWYWYDFDEISQHQNNISISSIYRSITSWKLTLMMCYRSRKAAEFWKSTSVSNPRWQITPKFSMFKLQ